MQQGINTLQAYYSSAMTAAENSLSTVQSLFNTLGCATTATNSLCSHLTDYINGYDNLVTFWNSSCFSQSTTPTNLTLIKAQSSTGITNVNAMIYPTSAIISYFATLGK